MKSTPFCRRLRSSFSIYRSWQVLGLVSVIFYSYEVSGTSQITLSPATLDKHEFITTEKHDYIYRFRLGIVQPAKDTRYSVALATADLTNGQNQFITASQIRLVPYGDFGDYTFFDIEFKNLTYSGTFTGELRIKIQPTPGSAAWEETIKVKLQLLEGIDVQSNGAPAPSAITKGWSWPRESDKLPLLKFTVRNKVKPKIVRYEMLLRGQTHSNEVYGDVLVQPNGDSVRSEVVVPISKRDMKADTYVGSLKVYLETYDTSKIATIVQFDNFTLKVKDGSVGVWIVLIVGLFVGRSIRLYNSKEIQDYYKFNDRIAGLRERAVALGSQATGILTQLTKVRSDISRPSFNAETVDAELDKLDEQIYDLENTARGVAKASLPTELKDKLDIRSQLANERAKRMLNRVTGLDLNHVAKSWWFRMACYIVTLAIVLLLGYQANYVGKADFGVAGLFDYFTVFLWASGSTAIVKTLFSVQQI